MASPSVALMSKGSAMSKTYFDQDPIAKNNLIMEKLVSVQDQMLRFPSVRDETLT
jgi:hypothetical protein